MKIAVSIFAIGIGFLQPAWALDAAGNNEMVSAHNKWRKTVGAPEIAWSESLAATAQAYAEKLKETKGCKQVHSHAPGLGENLFWASPVTTTTTASTGKKSTTSKPQDITSTQVTDAWGSEVSDYTYSENSCQAGKMCGHYTQVIWKSTTDVGCGSALCPDNSQVWVCNYTPPGNFVGQRPY